MATALQKRASRAAKAAAEKVKADGGDQAAQDAAADKAKADTLAAGDAGAGGDPGDQDEPRKLDPEAEAAIKAAGLNADDLEDEEIQDLVDAARADQARAAETAAVPGGPKLVKEANGRTDRYAIALLIEACTIYGVNPSADIRPKELMSWRFYPGEDDPTKGVQPDAVVFVTTGGVKIKHFDDPDVPMDPETEDRLRRIFGLFKQDPKSKEITALPLPDDRTLPATAVTGGVTSTEHQYVGGYLKAGGRKAAAEKQKRRDERAKRLGLA